MESGPVGVVPAEPAVVIPSEPVIEPIEAVIEHTQAPDVTATAEAEDTSRISGQETPATIPPQVTQALACTSPPPRPLVLPLSAGPCGPPLARRILSRPLHTAS